MECQIEAKSSTASGDRTCGTSSRLSFETLQPRIQLVFWNSFAAIQLSQSAGDHGIDVFPIFQKPSVLLLLRL
jgi:hypothetical protein